MRLDGNHYLQVFIVDNHETVVGSVCILSIYLCHILYIVSASELKVLSFRFFLQFSIDNNDSRRLVEQHQKYERQSILNTSNTVRQRLLIIEIIGTTFCGVGGTHKMQKEL